MSCTSLQAPTSTSLSGPASISSGAAFSLQINVTYSTAAVQLPFSDPAAVAQGLVQISTDASSPQVLKGMSSVSQLTLTLPPAGLPMLWNACRGRSSLHITVWLKGETKPALSLLQVNSCIGCVPGIGCALLSDGNDGHMGTTTVRGCLAQYESLTCKSSHLRLS